MNNNKKAVNKNKVILNLIQDLPRLLLMSRNGTRGRFQIKFGMTSLFDNGNSGFTLIELLVVVLIIGILAAVALPQYQKAVEKSKATQAITMLKTVYNAAKAYQISTGKWPENFDELSVDIPWKDHTSLIPIGSNRTPLSNDDWAIHIYEANNNANAGLTLMRLRGKYAGACFIMYANNTYTSMPTDQLLCSEESTVFNQTAGDYCVKIFQGKQVPNISSGTQYYSIF